MKVMILKVGDKKYTTSRVTAYISRQAMKISKESIELAKAAKGISTEETDLDAIQDLLEKLAELKTQKAWLVCQVYGDKFGVEDLEKEYTDDEIATEVQRITNGIYGIVSKNA